MTKQEQEAFDEIVDTLMGYSGLSPSDQQEQQFREVLQALFDALWIVSDFTLTDLPKVAHQLNCPHLPFPLSVEEGQRK